MSALRYATRDGIRFVDQGPQPATDARYPRISGGPIQAPSPKALQVWYARKHRLANRDAINARKRAARRA